MGSMSKTLFTALAVILLSVQVHSWVGVHILSTYGKFQSSDTASISTNGQYTFLPYRTYGLLITNISSTGAVTQVGRLGGTRNTVYALPISNSSNVLTAEFQRGVAMVDISDPTNPSVVKAVSNNEVYHLVQYGDYAYGACLGTICTYNVTDPSNPVWMGRPNIGRCRSIYMYGHYALLACDTRFRVYDLSTPGSPVLVHTTSGLTQHFTGYVDVEKGIYYCSMRTRDLRVYNISDPTSPVHVSSGPYGVSDVDKIDDQYLLLAGYGRANPCRIADHSIAFGSLTIVEEFGRKHSYRFAYWDPIGENVMVGRAGRSIDIYGFGGVSYGEEVALDARFQGITDMALIEDHLYASALGSQGIVDYNITDIPEFTASPSNHFSHTVYANVGSIEIVYDGTERYAVMAAHTLGSAYTAVNVTEPTNTTIIRQWGSRMGRIRYINHGFMAVSRTAGYMRHIGLINATELQNPEYTKFSTVSRMRDIVTDGSNVYAVAKKGFLLTFVFNTTSSELNQVDSLALHHALQAHLSKDSQTLFVSTTTGDLHIFDVSTGIPSLVSSLELPSQIPLKSMYQSNHVLFVGTDYGFGIADISDLSNPLFLSFTDLGTQAMSFRVSYPYAFVGTTKGLFVILFDASEIAAAMVDGNHGERDIHYYDFQFPPPDTSLPDISSFYPTTSSSSSSSSIWSTSSPSAIPTDFPIGTTVPSGSSNSEPAPDIGAAVTGDPHVSGFHGQKFDVTGEPGRSYMFFDCPDVSVVTTFVAGTGADGQTFISDAELKFKGYDLGTVRVRCDDSRRSLFATREDGSVVPSPAVSSSATGMVYMWEKSHTSLLFETPDATIEVDRMHSKSMACFLNLKFEVSSAYQEEQHLVGGILGATLQGPEVPEIDLTEYEI